MALSKKIGQYSDGTVTIDILDGDQLLGKTSSDSFTLTKQPTLATTLDGNPNGISDAIVTDNLDPTKGKTLTSTISYSQTDSLFINRSMDISQLTFTHIEKIQLGNGVNLTMTAEQFETAQNSLGELSDTGTTATTNPGLQVYGKAGGRHESLKILVDEGADFQLDDASTAYLFHDVDVTIQFSGGNVRYDGTAADETIRGGSGTEYITPRLGNDTVYAGAGDDLLIGHEGADKLYGQQGNDIFMISRIATKAGGGTFTPGKAVDGNVAELVAGDVMDGGVGIDELRITATGALVSSTENTITLTASNFRNIEKVTIATNAPNPKDANGVSLYASTQEQMAQGKYTAVTTGTDKINVDGSALKTAVIYTGNNGDNIIKGGFSNDEFHANGGNDALTGGKGSDKFVFDSALNAVTNVDKITDFTSGKSHYAFSDKLYLDDAIFTGLSTGKLNSAAFNVGTAATEADDRIIFDNTTGKLYFDADGSGAGTQTLFVELTGVSNLQASDITII
jgi:Ca2+-binding RTX toxin-like protein